MAKAKKHKPSTKEYTSISSSTSSSASNSSVKQQSDDKLQAFCNILLGNSKIGNFIVNCIILSLDATNITNENKIKYIKIIEQFLSKFVQETDEVVIEQLRWQKQLYNLVLIRDHLNIGKGKESVIEYLLNSEVFDKNLFNPNKLDDDNNLALLDLLQSLEDVLRTKPEINNNKKLIKWLKDTKGAKHSSEILQDKFNKGDYDENIQKFKQELQNYLPQEEHKGRGIKVVTPALENKRPQEFLECLDVILHNKRNEIPQRVKLFLCVYNKRKYSKCDEIYWEVIDTLLSKYYKEIDRDKYIEIIRSVIKDIPLKTSKMIHYEELINLYLKKISLKSFFTKEERELFDNYTNTLVELSTKAKISNDLKYQAYKKRFVYCKNEENLKRTVLQETIEVSLELIKYADNTEIKTDLYRLLIALYNIESSEFKTSTLNQLANDFKLSSEVKEKFIKLFSYHSFDKAFVKTIQEDVEIIKQALLITTNKQAINTTIIKYLQAFIMQIGEYSVSTIKEVIDDLDTNDFECVLRVLTSLQHWSKDDIEQVNYTKVLGTLSESDLKKDPIVNIKVAEFYLAIENLEQAKCCLDRAEKLLQRHKSSAIIEKHINEDKLSLMLNAFADNNKEFLNKNWGYIKEIYSMCSAKRKEFLEAFHSIIDICQYHILTKDPETSSNSQDQINKIVDKIIEDDELTFSLEIINQTTSEKKQPETKTHEDDNIGASSCGAEEYSFERKSDTKISDTAIQEVSYKDSFVTRFLNHGTIIHQYCQNIKKATRFSHDKSSDHHQKNYHTWNISNEVSYTTKKKDDVIRISKHKNIYAIIDPKLLGSLDTSEQQKFTDALKKGIVTDPKLNGVKICKKKCFLKLKIKGDDRLYPTIYENDDGGILAIFNKKANHKEMKKVLRKDIKVKKVPGGVDHSIQVEDDPLKYDVFLGDYLKYDEVSCMGDIMN
ncbi:hypothetical protein [Candidatus Tisiphia endosymbiont of Nedyus quadrimaculatus]|uniref:hypothetical protein n=1 Tax=Candidatus Tisiphia endosymbiont of Nedyus quadrimaculatus TaxID=3139332 RepID=UPI00345E676C